MVAGMDKPSLNIMRAADIAAHCPEPRLDLVAGGPVRE